VGRAGEAVHTFLRRGRVPTMMLHTLDLFVVYASAPLGGANAYMFYRCFLSVYFRRPPQRQCINMRQPFSGTAERIFMKLLPNDKGENGVSNAVPKRRDARSVLTDDTVDVPAAMCVGQSVVKCGDVMVVDHDVIHDVIVL